MLTQSQAPFSLGDCITLPGRGAASSEELAAGSSGESPPEPEEPGEGGFYPLLSVQQRLLLLGAWQLGSQQPEAWLMRAEGISIQNLFWEDVPWNWEHIIMSL